ncbi:hypothetical protein TNCV_4570521 [Trichonephila clavipes]|nr:hypothetical protein TNCV_4570521 [Trichonephila clavipes]
MDKRHVVNGVLLYTTIYVNCILCAVAAMTGRWIFLLLIVLTMGLTAYMMYMTTHNDDHLKSVSKWAEDNFTKLMAKVKAYYT